MTEEQMQAAIVMWFNQEFPSERRMLHCNNNNSVNRIAGNKAKAVGVVAGVSDLEWIDYFQTVYIELKLPNGTQSDEQIDFERKVRERGHQYIIIRSVSEFQSWITKRINNRK
jgi:hypothetical protein